MQGTHVQGGLKCGYPNEKGRDTIRFLTSHVSFYGIGQRSAI